MHDYVPLYFCTRSLMLLSVINAKNIDQMDILYFEFPISLVGREDAVFSDASANTLIPPTFYNDPNYLDKLNWDEIDSLAWKCSSDTLKQQRAAELLILNNLNLNTANRCIVWDNDTKSRVEDIVAEAGVYFPKIDLESRHRRHWFFNFQEGENTSVVRGPREIKMDYEQACELIERERAKHKRTAPFAYMRDLLEGMHKDFGCVKHTGELINLKSENGVHKRTVDIHTQEVVSNLISLAEYKKLGRKQKLIVELAAYFHDIGKGPRSRWDKNNGIQKVDPNHPVRAMPMMVDILTKYTGSISRKSAESLTKLVCYHDLVGDVLGRGRDKQQIVDIINDQDELDMLFALGRADVTALVEHWWDDDQATQLYDWCLAEM